MSVQFSAASTFFVFFLQFCFTVFLVFVVVVVCCGGRLGLFISDTEAQTRSH